MNKKAVITHGGMSQDLSQSKFSNTLYFEGRNVRITPIDSQTTGSITNTNGNEYLLTIPEITFDFNDKKIFYDSKELSYTTDEINDTYENITDFGESIVIGNCNTSDGFIIFTTNNEGLDCIWYLTDDFDLTLLYVRNMNFSVNNPIQCINNKENDKIDKIYFIDGKEQVRYLNIFHTVDNGDLEELIDIPLVSISIVSEVNFISPEIPEVLYGGTHTSGMIQYAYSYYKINGSESKISPLSNIIPLGKSNVKGGDPNEIVGTIPKIEVNEIDNRFTNIRIYAIKYTSYEALPAISLIADRNITGMSDFSYYDDGRIIQDISIEEFIFLSSNVIVPQHIEAKDSRLFLFNYKDRAFNLTLRDNNIDVRAYSFPLESTTTKVYSRITEWNDGVIPDTPDEIDSTYINGPERLDSTHAAINGDYNSNKYQFNSSTLGGEGPFLKYQIIRTPKENIDENLPYDLRFFKDEELYRIGIQFINKFGLNSTPMWIADFVTPLSGGSNEINNLNNRYAGIRLEFKPEFFVWLNTSSNFLDEDGNYDEFLKPVGFQLLRADRQLADRTILAQGILNGMVSTHRDYGWNEGPTVAQRRTHEGIKMPWFMRRFDDYLCPMMRNDNYRRLDDNPESHCPTCKGGYVREIYQSTSRSDKGNSYYQMTSIMQMYSPEVTFEIINNINSNRLKVIGGLRNNINTIKARMENYEIALFGDFLYDSKTISFNDSRSIVNSGITSRGLIGPIADHVDDRGRPNSMVIQLFRDYTGTFYKNNNPDDTYEVWNKPELTEVGASSTAYNNSQNFIYVNNLSPIKTGVVGTGSSTRDNIRINKGVTQGARCFTLVLGNDDTIITDRPTLENLLDDSTIRSQVTGDCPGVAPIIDINDIVSTYDDLLNYGSFTNQYIGVLQNDAVYFDNNVEDIASPNTFQSVEWIFNTLAEYDAFATETDDDDNLIHNLVGSLITIKEDDYKHKIYEVIDQETSIAGLDYVSDTFTYLDPSSSVNQFVETLSELYSLNTDGFNSGYAVYVSENETVYQWDEEDEEWNISSITPPIIDCDDYDGGVGLIVEFRNEEYLKYVGSYYGGNSYESKKNTTYVIASKYFTLNTNVFDIVDPGDTFVQEYTINRLSKTDEDPNRNWQNPNEIIRFRAESIINNNKRNDESQGDWRDWWRESQGDMHSYNRVYSQSGNLIKSQDISYEIKLNEEYTSGITTTHFKNPGETIDSWTKILPNEVMYLEGKYGSINGVTKVNNNIITFQNKAVANIQINPRVQVNADDGQGIYLGKGDILYDYNYLSIDSGTLNKWGIIPTQTGVYYYDTLNNSIFKVGESIERVTDIKSMKTFFENDIDQNIIKTDNHILKQGTTFGYDYKNNDIYFTFHQGENSYTLTFNEAVQQYVSFVDFKPSFYFNKGNIFLTTDNTSTSLYEHKNGIYNIYYGEYYPSSITYHVNPEPFQSCVFDNINFKSEVYLNHQDVWDQTLTHIEAYNEYQQTPLTPLIQGRRGNIRRRFRDWNADIPRDGRNRIRGPWTKLKVQFNNEDNYKLILHDLVIDYTI